MIRYTKKFDTTAEYETFVSSTNFVLPNVSLCGDFVEGVQPDVRYNPYHTYTADDCLTFTALEPTTFSFTGNGIAGNYIEYSVNNGTWTTLESGTNTPSLREGDRIRWRGVNTPGTTDPDQSGIPYGIGTFSSSGAFNADGNIMSILTYNQNNNTIDNTLGVTHAFYSIFNGCTGLRNAKGLILPATTLTSYCYAYMFHNCSNLLIAPELPATTLANNCYTRMFNSCVKLTEMPYLPSLVMTDYCYSYMFYNCQSITTVYCLPATTLAQRCYEFMFSNCTSLTSVYLLPATELVNGCYNNMFSNCSSLSYIRAMFTTRPSIDYTNEWVDGVAEDGIFAKNGNATWTDRGNYAVPDDWQIESDQYFLWQRYDCKDNVYADKGFRDPYIVTDMLYQPGSISLSNPIRPLAYIPPDGEKTYTSPPEYNDIFVQAALANIDNPRAVNMGNGKELRLYKTDENEYRNEVDTDEWFTFIGIFEDNNEIL